jgi:hypothetical protein
MENKFELFIYYLVLNNRKKKYNDVYTLTRVLSMWFGLYNSRDISLDLLSKGLIERGIGDNPIYLMTEKGNAIIKKDFEFYLFDLVKRYPDKIQEIELLASRLE